MTNTEARKIAFDECKVKCVACEEDCENMLIGECRKRLEALEQKPILDKIRAEIKALSNANPSYWHSGDMVEREEVFEIIDRLCR